MRFVKIFLLILLMTILLPVQLPAAVAEQNVLRNDGLVEEVDLAAILVDGKEAAPENRPFLLSCGRAVITLQALQNLIPCQSEQATNGPVVILWEQLRIELFPGQTRMLVNAAPRELALAPITAADGSILLPLRDLAEAMGYLVIFNAQSQTIELYSQGNEPPPQQPQPVKVDYTALPVWGSIFSSPGLTDLWPEEDILAGYFTRLVNSPEGRTNNIKLSAAKINGKMLQPDEIFSFNQTVGPRTAANGYQNAKIFSGKKVITGIGGGICQTSSTLYNAALEAGLPILERWPHSLPVAYAPPNRDATVSWGGADFKFRNASGSPLKILCQVESGYVFAAFAKVPLPAAPAPVPEAAAPVMQSRFFKVSESHQTV